MKARARTAVGTLVLLAALGAAVAVAYFGVHLRGEREQAAGTRGKRVLGIEAARVSGLRIEKPDGTVALVRGEGGAWRLTAPVAGPADGRAVDALLDHAERLERRATSAEPGLSEARLRAYGLAPPEGTVTFTLESGEARALRLGSGSGFDGAMFVQPPSGEVVVVPGDARYALLRTAYDLREKRLVPAFEEARVTAVEVTAPRGAYALAREGGGWKVTAPAPADADPGAAPRVLGALRDLRASSFGAAIPPGARPRYAVRVALQGGEERRVEVFAGPDDATLLVPAGPDAARVPASALAELDQDLASLSAKPPAQGPGTPAPSAPPGAPGGPPSPTP
jgi:hypothetical protein